MKLMHAGVDVKEINGARIHPRDCDGDVNALSDEDQKLLQNWMTRTQPAGTT